MLNKLSLKGRILLFSLLPAGILAVLLGISFTFMQVSQANKQLIQRSYLVGLQLAHVLAEPLRLDNRPELQAIMQRALEMPDIRAIHVHNYDGEPVIRVGPNTKHSTSAYSSQVQTVNGYQYSMLIIPIYESGDTEPSYTNQSPLGWLEVEVTHVPTLLESYRLGLISVLIILLGIALTAMLATYLANTLYKPLVNIRNSVAKVTEGALDTRLEPAGCPDLDALSESLNQMFISIEQAQEDLLNNIEQSTLDIRHNLETIEIQNIELNKARKEAVETSRIKSEFLANISHEIRTPLNGILGFTSLLKKTTMSSSQLQYLGTIQSSAENLLGILNEVLDFSRLEAGKVIFENMPFNLRDVIQDTLTLLSTSAHKKHIELISLVYQDTPNQLVGDPARLRQILTNLISNAIKFTHEGHVALRVMLEDEDPTHSIIRFCIQDTGIGLHSEDLKSLFEAFSQVNSNAIQTGTGLGLTITKHLIEQLNGSIGVSSQSDVGSEFWFTLPLKQALHEAMPVVMSEQENYSVITYEPYPLARQSLHLQLKELNLTPYVADDLEHAVTQVRAAKHNQSPFHFALLSVNIAAHPPSLVRQYLEELTTLNCYAMVICFSTEYNTYQNHLNEFRHHLCTKPLSARLILQNFSNQTPYYAAHSELELVPTPNNLTIMCVDDNQANLQFLTTLLQELNVNVLSFSDGWSAYDAFKLAAPDMVLLDIQMPGLDGKETLKKMRTWEHEAQRAVTPIVAVTAHAFIEERRDLKQRGFNDFMTKPLNEEGLIQLVLTWTGELIGGNTKRQHLLPLPTANKTIATTVEPEPLVVVDPISQLPVFDFSESIQLSGGRKKLAIDLLNLLLDSLPKDREFIRQAHIDKRFDDLLERVHRLHGATKYCGVPQLRAQCKHTETLLKTKATTEQYDIALKKLDDYISKVMIECRGKLT